MDQPNEKEYCTLYIIRHGETEWNTKRLLQGHLDSPLTEAGVAQVSARAAELKDVHFDAIFSSDLPRAMRSAEIIKLDRDILVQASELLRERNHGSFGGMHLDEYKNNLKEKMLEKERLSSEKQWSFKIANDVESDGEVASRLLVQLREIALAYPRKNVAVVTHGGCMHIILIKLGYAQHTELVPLPINNAACIKILSDGVDFFVKETWGVAKGKGQLN